MYGFNLCAKSASTTSVKHAKSDFTDVKCPSNIQIYELKLSNISRLKGVALHASSNFVEQLLYTEYV